MLTSGGEKDRKSHATTLAEPLNALYLSSYN